MGSMDQDQEQEEEKDVQQNAGVVEQSDVEQRFPHLE